MSGGVLMAAYEAREIEGVAGARDLGGSLVGEHGRKKRKRFSFESLPSFYWLKHSAAVELKNTERSLCLLKYVGDFQFVWVLKELMFCFSPVYLFLLNALGKGKSLN
ncbi:hypothetical protein MKW98_025312 [Papaver atlanticum]|uniref:Uncharacterized protein n=1 Tax=Papaver atlanticum TaxID=357466 RepID=A0AAD4X9Q4_9MAGN|nr:hypothetical protein MKW98_025312 [Papaver atlanticum]